MKIFLIILLHIHNGSIQGEARAQVPIRYPPPPRPAPHPGYEKHNDFIVLKIVYYCLLKVSSKIIFHVWKARHELNIVHPVVIHSQTVVQL